jgi:hypothetical protein
MYNHSILIFSVYLHKFSRVYNTGTIIVSLNHTFKILNINKILKSHVKSSQAELLYSSVLLVPIRSVRVLPSLLPLFPASLEFLFTHIAEERTLTNSTWHVITIHSCDVTAGTENTASLLFRKPATDCDNRGVGWQHVDQNCYKIIVQGYYKSNIKYSYSLYGEQVEGRAICSSAAGMGR